MAWLAREILIFCGTRKVMPAPEAKGVFWCMGSGFGVRNLGLRLNTQTGPQACGLAGAGAAHLLRHQKVMPTPRAKGVLWLTTQTGMPAECCAKT